jgi:hypothetical protein
VNPFLAFWHWWFAAPDRTWLTTPIAEPELPPQKGEPTELAEQIWREKIWRDGYQHGFAAGQINGRQALFTEIEQRLAGRARPPEEYGESDLEADKFRQLH